jgi:hypothetical protein
MVASNFYLHFHLSEKTKHIGMKYHFGKDLVQLGTVKLRYLPTRDMVADMMTKTLHGPVLVKHRSATLHGNKHGMTKTLHGNKHTHATIHSLSGVWYSCRPDERHPLPILKKML